MHQTGGAVAVQLARRYSFSLAPTFLFGLLGFVNECSVSVSRSKVAVTDWDFLVCITDNTETGTIVSLVYDIPRKRITTLIAFSKGEPYICLFLAQPLFLAPPPLPISFLLFLILFSLSLFQERGTRTNQDPLTFCLRAPKKKATGRIPQPPTGTRGTPPISSAGAV